MPSIVSDTLTEHTLVKLKIKNGIKELFIHDPQQLAELLRALLNHCVLHATRIFNFYERLFSKGTTHDW